MAERPPRTAYSKVSVKSQTVLPNEVRQHLGIGPGDRLRYRITPHGVEIDKAPPEDGDPFVAFSEWGTTIDDEDYADL